jgi:hypothetical protein
MESEYQNLVIKTSKTELPIPVVDGVHLHSAYNPEREAEGFLKKNEEVIRQNSNLLILGSGFGYHLKQILYYAKKIHKDKARIFVIDPNIDVIKKAHELNVLPIDKQLIYKIGPKVQSHYQDRDLLEFLVLRPSLIAHPASFHLYDIFFKTFFTYKSPSKIKDILCFIENDDYKNSFSSENDETLFIDHLEKIKTKNNLTPYDFLTLAIEEISGL